MADVDITDQLDDELVATTLDEMLPTVYDQTVMSNALGSELENSRFKETRNGGARIRAPLRTGKNNSFSTFGVGSVRTPQPYPIMNFCYWNFKQGAGDVIVDWVEEREQASSGNVIDLVEQRVQALIDGVRESMNEMLWASTVGNAGMDLNGLQFLVPTDPRTGVMAGFDRASHYWWRNQYWDNSSLSYQPHPSESGLGAPANVGAFGSISNGVSTALMRMATMVNDIIPGENLNDLFIITDQLVYEQFEMAAQYMKNFRIAYEAGADTVRYNFGNALFRGIPIRFDAIDAPSGEMRFINTKYYKLISDSGAWYMWTEERKPYNQFAKVRYLMLRGQCINLNPSKHAVLQGITAWA